MTEERIIVKLANPERKYAKVHHDFLDNSFLTVEEQMIFIVLKSYVDFSSNEGEVFPSMETISRRSKLSKPRAKRSIDSLIKKGIIKRRQRGLTKTNLYTIADYPKMWTCNNAEEIAEIVDNKGEKPLTAEEHIAELEKMGYKVEVKKEVKEKELVSAVDQTTDTSTHKPNLHNDTTDEPESQECCSTSEADADALLDRLWVLYPVKKGKGQISAARRKKLLKIGYDEMARAIERYKRYVESVDYLHYQNGGTFFNGGYVDYLDANYDPKSELEAKSNQKKNMFNDYPHREYDFDAIKKGMFEQ